MQWKEVPCLDRNGEITGFRVIARTSGEDDKVVNVSDGNAREANISGLNLNTQYIVDVAAVNNAGTGPNTTVTVQTPGECIGDRHKTKI